ncbi:Nitrilase/cyanide hydratase and apolipoprotein N- acyltransferase [Xylanimonas cellulosilytica DSM 15894]|uniref:Nitrilase/cyanide hydratase and apolipoprotein N-acyltransferase n=1 Tax=Xylanimonas cellulosilytica (strain DSM 15894 / JCM 12276 / CECT 5975 / KCTC 9989 / LMG 20990 / NBRC 107835 / XIL07) TaxID=446471 RepID=D1BX77_XYLCX|nr:carbon-nitrogen hydrolase family protein [Xylanimonas cellulosilytica]ACZ31645.1 Nitrilase/cyanide hydratase and apolipoprotein N- acyltransferase [Xylanimonas cellulosilytica DSM 15894]
MVTRAADAARAAADDGAADDDTSPAGAPESLVRVAIAQIEVGADHAANRDAVTAVVRDAAARGADLVVLPEYASGFEPRGVGPEHAEPLDGPFVSLLRALAREHGLAIVAGTTLPGEAPGRASNAIVAVGAQGELAGAYRKVHLYDAFGTRESDRLEPGPADAAPLTFAVGGLTVGVLTCYDLRFPEAARRVVDAGAQAILYPAAWVAGPLKADHWRTLLRARAIENTVAVVGVGMAGRTVTGRSLVVDADGVVVLELDETPQLAVATLDPTATARTRAANPSLANRRYEVVPRQTLR